MSSIVVMEDDDTLRLLVSSILKKQGYTVFQASNGELGLELVRRHKPSLVVSDVQMPKMDGMAMLETLRGEAGIAHIPVVLLTSLADRAHVRIGMTSGADDYLTKPFLPVELQDAVAAQLARQQAQSTVQSELTNAVVRTALETQRHSLARVYEKRLQAELSGDRWPSEKNAQGDAKYGHATVLFVDLIGHLLSEALSSSELSEAIKYAFTHASDSVHLFGARHVHLVGDGLLAIFVEDTDTASVNHSMRACRSAFGLVKSVKQSRRYAEAKFNDKKLPILDIGVALHSGPVTVAHLADPMHGSQTMVLPVGETVNLAMHLQKQTAAIGWSVAATDALVESLHSQVQPGRKAVFTLRTGVGALPATELLELKQAL